MRKAVLLSLFALLAFAPAASATSAACETVIWGNRLAGDAASAAGLVPMVDLNTEAGAAWYAAVNDLLSRSSRKLEALLAAAPAEPGATFAPAVEVNHP